ncbi:ankyrin repeat-containing domain protein [Mycotypha africana]|uniref:ankyrin repeat-containing domain protein n=1 Tax=Mycotypha africana TaxID=64632 RepID=UPI0023017F17|nr:ankyrin repeat-containing domain protein [Mycotypha africana]KAI8991308.1 ankyrin repeat-containing domain protein [Mycotypha africana]
MTMKAPTSQDNLWVAAGDGQLDRVRELIEVDKIDVNSHDEFGYTAMHAAVSYNQKEIVEYLLKNGANVDIEDFDKDTPLYVAETVEMAELLLNNGADPKHKNKEGITPALTAHEEGWTEVAVFLANKTGEELPQDGEEQNTLAHVESDAKPSTYEISEKDDEALNELTTKMEDLINKVKEQDGVPDEEELRELVYKMLVDEMQRGATDNNEESSQVKEEQ